MLMMLVGTMIPPHQTSAATLIKTETNPNVVTGTTDQPNQDVTIVANEKIVRTKSDASKNYTYTFDKALTGQIAVYQRDAYGFDQLIDVTERSQPEAPATPVKPQGATFIGMINNEFVFLTHPNHTIHATYEGRVRDAIGELRIPKNKADTVSVYVSSPEKASTPIQTYTATAATADIIQLDAPPHETLRVSGKTLPYVYVNVKVGHEVKTGQADATGQFDFPFTGWEPRAYQNQTYTVQAAHLNQTTEGVQAFTMPAFVATMEKPLLVIEESFTQFRGVTLPDSVISLDGETCTVSDEVGYFGCYYPQNDQSKRTFTIQQENATIFTKEVTVKRDVRTIKFETKMFDLDDAQLIGKATPNQTFIVTYEDRRAGYRQIRFRANSDTNGDIVFPLPKLYGVNFTVSYLDEYDYRNPLWAVRAEDNRPAPTPILKMQSDRVAISVPSFYYPNQSLTFEAKIEKADGRSLLEKADLNNPSILLEVNDTFMIRTVLQDGRVSEWVEGKFDAIQKPLIPDLTNDTTLLKGTTEPNASLKFTSGVVKEVKADAQGKFEFAVDLKKVKTINVLVSVSGKADQTFKYEVKDTVRPMLEIYNILSEDAKELMFDANEYVGNFEIVYYKNNTIVRKNKVNPIRPYKPLSSGFSLGGMLPVSGLKTDGITHLIIHAEDLAGNPSGGNKIMVKDTTAPRVILQKHVLAGEHLIYGKTEPGSTVTFTYRSDKDKPVVVSSTGMFTIKTTDPVVAQKYGQVKITATDKAGNKGYGYISPNGEKIQDIRLDGGQKVWFYMQNEYMNQNHYEFTVNGKTQKYTQFGSVITWPNDIALPATVTIKLINPDKTVKYEMTKVITKPYVTKAVSNVKFQQGVRKITGNGDPYATLEVWSGTTRLGYTGVDGLGKFDVNLVRAYNEGEKLRFVMIPKIGKSQTTTINAKDNTAPTAPSVNEIKATSTHVSGKTEKGATVFISYNGKTYTTKATSTGSYAFKINKWLPGKVVSVHVKDAAGNQSPVKKETIKYVFKQFSVNTLRSSHIYVTGKGHPGATVQVYNGASKVGKAVKVDAKGNFKAYVNKQRQGNMLTVEMTRSGYATERINTTVQR
ncbi:Ig-like domain-containing protein [Exiguobacterium alkaliphilum]|nr:Ig-like domain-containing protein [Exiguobacterium alkaliphilum]